MEKKIKITTQNIKDYLKNLGFEDIKKIEEVTKHTNVNYVFKITLGNGAKIFIKQAFPYVKVAPTMEAPLNRQFFENLSLKWMHNLSNLIIPKIIEYDKKNDILVLNEAGKDALVLSDQITKGHWELQIIPSIAKFCAELHSKTFETKEMIRPEKENKEHINFIINFRLKGAREVDKEATQKLFNESLKTKSSLIYGDFASKNILIQGKDFYLVDFENVCRFDPSFDIGYLLAHWFIEIENKEDFNFLMQIYDSFFKIYSERFKENIKISEEELTKINKRAKKYVGAIMAHRLFGGAKNPNLIKKEKEILDLLKEISINFLKGKQN